LPARSHRAAPHEHEPPATAVCSGSTGMPAAAYSRAASNGTA